MRKKTILIIGLIGVLLVSGVIAQLALSRDINVGRERLAKAKELGIEKYETEDFSKDGLWQRCLIRNASVTNYNLPCSPFMDERDLDNWERTTIVNILDTEIERAARGSRTKERDRETTLS